MAPAFRLDNVREGEPSVDLGELRGRPVVINFWASWCAPCIEEMPALQRVHRRFGDRVAFVGVDGADSRRKALEFMAKTGVTYPSGYDPQDRVYRAYRLFGRPITVFVDEGGRVLGRHAGRIDEAELERLVRRLFRL